MIARLELRRIARARLSDAKALTDAGRYDGAAYLCGYAVEIALKARVCRTLKWSGFPSTRKEFENYTSFRTHNLDVLLSLSGQEDRIKTTYFADWSAVSTWDPEQRYNVVGTAKKPEVERMIVAAETLLRAL